MVFFAVKAAAFRNNQFLILYFERDLVIFSMNILAYQIKIFFRPDIFVKGICFQIRCFLLGRSAGD